MAPQVAWLLSVSFWVGFAVVVTQSPWHGAIQQQQQTFPHLQAPPYRPEHHVDPEQNPWYQHLQQVKPEQHGPPPGGDATSSHFHRLPMFRHAPGPVVPPGLFRPVSGKRPFPDALTSLLFPAETLPTSPPARRAQQPTVEVWCGDDAVSVRVDRFRLGSWAAPARFRLGSCSCSEVTPQFLVFHYKLAECQGTLTTVKGPLEYRNTLVFTPPPQEHIIRAVPLELPIYCHYNRFHYSYKVGYRPHANPIAYMMSIKTKRGFSLTVCNAQWQPLLPDQSFTLGETVNFVAQTGSLLAGERLYVDSCYITASRDPNSAPRLHVITKFGCMADSMRQGSNSRFWPGEGSVVRFSVDAFMFPGFNQQLLFLHCSMSVGSAPSASSKSCTFNPSTSRWEELEAHPSVCSCCDSECTENHIWPSSVSPAVRSLITSVGWVVKEETADEQQSGDTTTGTPPHQAEDPWRVETTGEEDMMKYKRLNIPEEEVISGEEEEKWKKIRGGGAEEETTRRFDVHTAAHVKVSAMSRDNRQGDGHPGLMDQDAEAGLSSHTSDAPPTATSTVRYAPAYKATELLYRYHTSSVTSTPGLTSTSDATTTTSDASPTTASAVRYAPAYKATELVYRFDTSSVSSTPGLISTSTSRVIPTSTPSFANINVSTAMTAIVGPSPTSHSTPTSQISSSTSDGTKGFSSGNSNGTRFDIGVSIHTVGKTSVPNVTLGAQSDPGTTVLGSDQGSKTIKTGSVDTADIREPAETRGSSGSEDLDRASLLEQGSSGPVEGIPDNAPGLQLGMSVTRAGPDGFDVSESLWTNESESTGPTETGSGTSGLKVDSSDGSVWTRWPDWDEVSSEEALSEVLVSGTGPGPVHASLVDPQNLGHSSATVIVTTNVSQTGGKWAGFESEQDVQGARSVAEKRFWLDGEFLRNQMGMEPLAVEKMDGSSLVEEKMEIIGDVRFSDEEKVLAKRREGGEIMDREGKATEKENDIIKGLWFKGMRRGRAKVLEQEKFRSGPVSQWGGHRRPEQQEEVSRFLLGSKKPEVWSEDSAVKSAAGVPNSNLWNDPGMPENRDQVISGVLLEHTDDKSGNLE